MMLILIINMLTTMYHSELIQIKSSSLHKYFLLVKFYFMLYIRVVFKLILKKKFD